VEQERELRQRKIRAKQKKVGNVTRDPDLFLECAALGNIRSFNVMRTETCNNKGSFTVPRGVIRTRSTLVGIREDD